MMSKGEYVRRSVDDVVRILALIICLVPVGTMCGIFVFSYVISSAGGSPPPLQEVTQGLRDLCLIVIGGASGIAFGRRSSMPTPEVAPQKE